MKTQVALFGAGNNARGVIRFLGRKNIQVVIDNDERRWGTVFEEVEVVSFPEFTRRGRSVPVLITITTEFGQKAVVKQLKKAGIDSFYFAPFIQFGFYRNVADLVSCLGMDVTRPLFYGNNPITDKIIEELERRKLAYDILDCVEEEYPFLNREKEREHLIRVEKLDPGRVLYITDNKPHDLERFANTVVDIMIEYHRKYLPRHEELAQFKNIHKDKRCFLIGNGPSLCYEDLEKLRTEHEITFGVNRIYLSFNKTLWRPDYYVMVDSFMVRKDARIIQKYGLSNVFIGDNYSEEPIKECENYFYFSRMPNTYGEDCFSADITKYVYGGSTVIYDAMQIAMYMGFKEIVLLGVDMTQIKPGEDVPHFYENKSTDSEILPRGNTTQPMKAFSIARAVAEKRNVRMINATRGGNVEVLERIPFDDLFTAKIGVAE